MVRPVSPARDEVLHRDVAFKLGTHAANDSMLAEARAMAKLAHPNCVVVHEVVASPHGFLVAMELVEGATLRTRLAESPPRREIARLLAETGRGLLAAHEAGIVHRDVKPDNVLVGRDGRARVGDFGLAAGQGAERAGGGTPAYAPPETALALAELASGKDNPQVLTYHAALAMALQSTGDFEGAEASVLRARAFALHKHGPGGDLPPGGGGTSRPSPMPRARSPRRSST